MKGISKTPPSHLPAQSPRAADSSASSLLAGKSNIFQLICMTKAHIFRVEKKKKKKGCEHLQKTKKKHNEQTNNACGLYPHHTQAKHKFPARSYAV